MRCIVFVLSGLFIPGKIRLSPPSSVKTPTTQFSRGSVAIRPGLGGTRSSYSWVYRVQASPSCFMLLRQAMPWALVLAFANAGKSRPARIAMMAMTTRSSIKVKPTRRTAEGPEPGIGRDLIVKC